MWFLSKHFYVLCCQEKLKTIVFYQCYLSVMKIIMVVILIIIPFTFKDTTLYLPVFTLSSKGNQNLSKSPSKEFNSSVYFNEYIAKSLIKDTKICRT